jgi:hypothetical protein
MLETPYAVCAVAEIGEIAEDELERWVATTRAALDEADTVESYLDWKRQARQTIWLLATETARTSGRRSASVAGTRRKGSCGARFGSSVMRGAAPVCMASSGLSTRSRRRSRVLALF